MTGKRLLYYSLAALLLAATLAAAHGDEAGSSEMGGMEMSSEHSEHAAHAGAAVNPTYEKGKNLPTYWKHPEYKGWIWAHVSLMILSWVVVLPIGVMLSVARSRLTALAQVVFLALNGLGVFTSIVYNAKTPDLYPNNAHHKMGWIFSMVAVAWFVMSFPMVYLSRKDRASHQMTAQNMTAYNQLHSFVPRHQARWSRDSGHSTEGSATLADSRSSSSDSILQHKLEEPASPIGEEHGDDLEAAGDSESHGFLGTGRVDRFVTGKLPTISGRAFTALKVVHCFLERVILVLGFVLLCTGGVTWAGLFFDRLAFSGAAHFVKGGIFFWYGFLTLGRYIGAFSELGWAWNRKPSTVTGWRARMPSAEFVESFVIWLYGASNVFLEHLNAWGQAWTFEDFEHISITVLFFGGGLLGMLIESETVRNLVNTAVSVMQEEAVAYTGVIAEKSEEWRLPKSYRTSLNPIPALVIMLLGKMMSGHVQASMVSTMMHAQWGSLFVGFALSRAATYVILYLAPPSSHFPSRPPSELIASFCLISGGLIFMGSATDTVATIEGNGLDAMFLFTVAMGFSALLMAWAVVTFAFKGWAVRRENRRA